MGAWVSIALGVSGKGRRGVDAGVGTCGVERFRMRGGLDDGRGLRHGAAESVGGRRAMEDAHGEVGGPADESLADLQGPRRGFFVVCDGHNGSDAAHFAKAQLLRRVLTHELLSIDMKEALRSSFLRVDEDLQKRCAAGSLSHSGTTALAAVVVDDRLTLANAGDCRAVLSRSKGRSTDLTPVHRPSCASEQQRIKAAGGYVDGEGYLNGDLGVSRALGDWDLTHLKYEDGGPLTAEPEVVEVPIEEDFEFMVLASDGAFDVMSSQTVVDIARRELVATNDPCRASQAVVDAALAAEVHDNVTVVTVCFGPQAPAPKCRQSTKQPRFKTDTHSFRSLQCAMEGDL